jgi:hypothetical protein
MRVVCIVFIKPRSRCHIYLTVSLHLLAWGRRICEEGDYVKNVAMFDAF